MTCPKLLWAVAVCLAAPVLACTDDTPSDRTENDTETGEDPETSGDGDGDDELGDGDGDGEGDGDGDGDGDPEPVCTEGSCSIACTVETEMESEMGGTCTCEDSVSPDGYVECDVPDLCADKGHLCRMQALRYGVYGQFSVITYPDGDFNELTVQMFGDGTARAQESGYTHTCCGGGGVDGYDIFHHASGVISSGGSFWTDCTDEIINLTDPEIDAPSCLEVGSWSTTCEGPIGLCPAPLELGDSCEESCPMAGDGICDEAQGTGLCDAGCDPIDCSCDADQPDVCDEISSGGTCPIGSDPDCN